MGRHLKNLPPHDIRRVLNQGEYGAKLKDPPLILWTDDHLLHTAVSGLMMLGRLVIHSRTPARNLIALGWSEVCSDPARLVSVAPPPLADLSQHYDVCVIGSGAGGATIASRLTAEGKRVLILDLGDFVSPDALIQRLPQRDGSIRFQEGCRALGEEVQPLPVAMRRQCSGCGSDNSVDSFGDHIGGVHPYHPGGPNSFLVQAMNHPEPAQV